MKSLPIYTDGLAPLAAIEQCDAVDRDTFEDAGRTSASGAFYGRACDRCALSTRTRKLASSVVKAIDNPCIAATGKPGGLLIVGDPATLEDDRAGKPMSCAGGKIVRDIVGRHWQGPVTYDAALRCAPGQTKVTDKHYKACRPLLADTLTKVAPTRIITLGAGAAYSLFGRSVPPLTSRGAYGWIRGAHLPHGPVAVFMLLGMGQALRNRFVKEWFKRDLVRALHAPDPREGPWTSRAHVVETIDDAERAEADLMTNDWIAFDVETMGEMWTPEFRVMSCALVGDVDEQPWIWDVDALSDPAMLAVLARVLTSKKLPKVGSNVKYDQLAMRSAFKMEVAPIIGDTRLSRKLIDPEAGGKLAAMAELVGMGGMKDDAEERMSEIVGKVKRRIRKQWGKKKPTPLFPDEEIVPGLALHPEIDAVVRVAEADMGKPLDAIVKRFQYGMLPHDELIAYNARDSIATARVEHYVREKLPQSPSLERVWKEVVLPGTRALERVEAWGIGANVNAIKAFDAYLGAKEAIIAKRLSVYPDVDWNSPKQVADLLFGKLNLPVVKNTPKGALSTDEAVLEALKNHHPVCADLLEHRSVTKMRGTYASGMLPHVRPDGRIHPNIKLDGARSGRTSCTSPNLQNIPRATGSDEGKMARDCFIARPGFKLVELDFSQLEYRVAAMLSQDPVMIAIFNSGVDYHLRTAQLVSQIAWGIAPIDVTDKHRSLAKSVNFGVLYGKTTRSLAEEWGVTIQKAEQVVNAIMGQFKLLAKWCAERRTEANTTGEVWTWWDGEQARRRPLWRIADEGNTAANITATNGAVNSPVQGTASDFCIVSLAQSVDWIESEGIEDDVKLCLAVHDSLLFEVRDNMVDETAHTVRAIMTGHESWGVPLDADCKTGQSWGSMESYKFAA